ncbi:hypothetical protein CAC42_4363 [Sphaceloma murrayae]|uniref:Vacuolar ATPase assembly protein VMA22 n=1 Tax=Sphaceloma murrayae TaxID=2082308 RepID=A0A2K1QLZ9_9PEZI|nr:hypothetical protein CAC42_4363 [Sphaceloma murrayae]
MTTAQEDSVASEVVSVDLEELKRRLEASWIRYLDFLDQYSKAQQQISKYYSEGMFSLAEANFKNSTRTRYGQEYYDGRMQAATKYAVSGTSSVSEDPNVIPRIKSDPVCIDDDKEEDEKSSAPSRSDGSSPGILHTALREAHGDSAESRDPIKWFGILVPPQLRSCQRSFLGIATGPVLEAVNASRSLREVEIDIRRLRKEIRKAERRVGSTNAT